MLMNLKKQNAINGNRILSRNNKYLKKQKSKAFQNIAAILEALHIKKGILSGNLKGS